MIRSRRARFAVALLVIVSASAFAARISDVRNTPHNLSATPYTAGTDTRTVKATSESQICVFCHTPHKANAAAKAPLWNRALSGATYTTYTSESMDATLAQPDGSSKLCLSCHDGTMALGSVGVLNGQENVNIAMSSTNIDGSGATTGYTRNLGTALTNDHPISFTYDSTLASADGELVDPAVTTYIKNRTPGATHPDIPLENGKVQCVACHDPHIRDVDMAKNAKFLRLNRFQENAPNGGTFSATDDTVCLACHDKDKAGWSGSAHANPLVATQTYSGTSDAVTKGGFNAGMPVWQAACLNCHDTHTVQGARRLLRAGTDSTATPKAGGNPALEETCYQCHDGTASVITPTTTVPNIKTDFGLAKHMPITSTEQAAGSEVHAIGTGTDVSEGSQRGKDFVESPTLLGKGNLNNRHAECTDCHNPHRVIKNRLFNANPATPDAAGTHTHTLAAGQTHSNLASGVLAGTTGIEPVYGATTWGSLPTTYTLKKGNGGSGASTAVNSAYVTREYQICLKCHSDYAWNTAPTVGPSIGTNGVTQYTNQAMEFQAPLVDQGEATATHRSWHPVMDKTGRTAAVRANMDPTLFLAPWNNATATTNIGNQTMYCSDCHGSATGTQTVVPNAGNPWGPHGSGNAFILKGTWDNETGNASQVAGTADTSGICFKCHDWNEYANPNNATPKLSGFRAATATTQCRVNFDTQNLHIGHAARIGQNLECSWCHAAVPHGWKNKALLINVFADAPECNPGAAVFNGCNSTTSGPYIRQGYLGAGQFAGGTAVTWATSGNWASTNCGGRNWMNGVLNANNSCLAPL